MGISSDDMAAGGMGGNPNADGMGESTEGMSAGGGAGSDTETEAAEGEGGAGGAGGGAGDAEGAATATADQLVFLGTQGGPQYTLTRGETATALIVDGVPYLIDCGYGTLRALIAADINYLSVGQIFLTHMHDDHCADLAALLGHQWTRSRPDPTSVIGPYGTDALVAAAVAFMDANARIRMADEGRPVPPSDLFSGTVVEATEAPAMVFEDERIVVTSIENTHYPEASKANLPDRSLAYRIESASRSVVFSGDTTYSDRVVELAQGANILVCETIDVPTTRVAFDAMVANGAYGDNPEAIWEHIVETHTPCDDAGRMAADANVETLVLNHLVPGALNPDQTDEMYIDQITPYFTGNVVVSKDLMIM
jgi:ribonuclease BN (tRNA processing enzyme)